MSAWSRCAQTKSRLASEIFRKSSTYAKQTRRHGCATPLQNLTFFCLWLFWMTGAAKPDDKAPCDCSGRFRNAQWQTLICCLLSKIAQMPHLAGRETLRHLFAGHFLRTALWTCKLGEPGISPSQPPTFPFALSGDPESALGPAGEHWAPGDLELGTRGALTPGHRLQALRAPESCPAACQGPGQPSQLAGREGCEQSRQRSHQKISLAPSLAGSGCQCMGSCRRRGGTMLPGLSLGPGWQQGPQLRP